MPDTDCQTACAEAYTAQVGHCADVLREQLAQTEFEHCMALAEKVKAACLQACEEN